MTDQPYAEAVLQSLRTAENHIYTEYVDDIPGTLASVSREPRYAMMPAPGRVAVVTDNAGVEKFYDDARLEFLPCASRIVAQLATDWYMFLENVPTRKRVQTGKMHSLHTATLFPKAPDGIRGEFLWERYVTTETPGDVPALEGAVGPLPLLSVRNLNIHECYLGCLCRGEVDRIVAMLDDNCIWAVRSYLPDAATRPMIKAEGPAQVRKYITDWLNTYTLERVSILNRLVTDWYIFAEELLVVNTKDGSGRRQYRKASIYPITPKGRMQGELGYGTDLETPSPSADRTLGTAFWIRDDLYPSGRANLEPRS